MTRTDAKPVKIDLRRDFGRVLKVRDKLIESRRGKSWGCGCTYSAPCVIGVMVPKSRRDNLDEVKIGSDTTIGTLLTRGFVVAPDDQRADLTLLQKAYDSTDPSRLAREIDRVAEKYRWDDDSGRSHPLPAGLDNALIGEPSTFGALAKRLEQVP